MPTTSSTARTIVGTRKRRLNGTTAKPVVRTLSDGGLSSSPGAIAHRIHFDAMIRAAGLAIGFALRRVDWAAAVTATYDLAPLVGATATIDGKAAALHATGLQGRLAIARYVPQLDVAIGAAIDVVQLAIVPECTGCK